MQDNEKKVAAKCRICGRQLTIEEFRACSGVGHYCSIHLRADMPKRSSTTTRTRTTSSSRRSTQTSSSGAADYPCRAQFARNGQIRRGRLTTDHPSSVDGHAIFVSGGIGYGPGEVVTLFIKSREGRLLAERAGFECHG